MSKEVPLGGMISDATRVGQTVRRRAGDHTPSVHALLRHLEGVGFSSAPRVLGFDEQGREVLTFIEGEVVAGWPEGLPTWTWSTSSLVSAAQLLRRFHDATADFVPPPRAHWQTRRAPEEIICHYDPAPYNMVFRGGIPVAILDFDLCGPGPRSADVGLALWLWVPFAAPRRGFVATDTAARFRLFCESYGIPASAELLDGTIEQMEARQSFGRSRVQAGDPGFVRLWKTDADIIPNDIAYLRSIRADLLRMPTVLPRGSR